MLKIAEAQRKAALAKEREQLTLPADAAAVAKLAPRYASSALGELKILKEHDATVFDAGAWKGTVASRRNDDGTISFITIDPTLRGLEFFVADEGGKRRLVIRDGQHEYAFIEEASAGELSSHGREF